VGAALSAFAVAAVVIVLLMFTVSVAIATAQEGMIAAFRTHVKDVKRWGAWILIAVGAWLLVLAAFADFFVGMFPV
jgi:hypothetical protein